MDILKLRAFLLIEKHKSFSGAAQDLSYTPSALSHIADSLEQELGAKLFVRTQKGVSLTEGGKRLLPKISAVVKAEEDLLESASRLSGEKEQILKIGTYASIALHLLPKLLRGFKQAYPMVKTQILVADNMQNWLEDGTADIILADTAFATEQFLSLTEDAFVAVVPESEFPGRDTIALEELHPYALIRPREEYLDNFLDYDSFREIIPVDSVENDSAVYLVKEKLGVVVLPSLCLRNCPPDVRVLKLEQNLSRTIGLSYNKRGCSQVCRWFVRYIMKEMK